MTATLSLVLVIMSNNKETNNQKEVSTKCLFGITEKFDPFKKIGDYKLYTTKDLILATKGHLVDICIAMKMAQKS